MSRDAFLFVLLIAVIVGLCCGFGAAGLSLLVLVELAALFISLWTASMKGKSEDHRFVSLIVVVISAIAVCYTAPRAWHAYTNHPAEKSTSVDYSKLGQ